MRSLLDGTEESLIAFLGSIGRSGGRLSLSLHSCLAFMSA